MKRAQPHFLDPHQHRTRCRAATMGASKVVVVEPPREQGWFACFAFGLPLFSRALRFSTKILRVSLPLHRTLQRLRAPTCAARLEAVKTAEEALVSCGGGGTFFFWQLGAARAIAERRAGRRTVWAGSSAGALCAALTLCEVDPWEAVKSAHRLAHELGLYTRKGGLFGVRGETIRRWLEELLPEDAAHRCGRGVLYIQVTVWSGWRSGLRVKRVSSFESRAALIDTLMASVHIPYFLDGRLFARFESNACDLGGRRVCDGSILQFLPARRLFGIPDEDLRVTCEKGRDPDYFISHQADRSFDNGGPGFVELLTLETAVALMDRGYSFTTHRLDDSELGPEFTVANT